MKRVILSVLLLSFAVFLFTGCSSEEDKPFVNDPPTNLRFYLDSDTTAVFTWKASPDATDDNFLYYQIFTSSASFTGVDPSLDTVGLTEVITTTDTFCTIAIQRNVRKYYIVKCVLNLTSDARYSARSNEVNLAGVFMGEDTLYQVSSDTTRYSGYAFDATTGGSPYTMTIANSTTIQFYIGSTGTTDGPGSPALKSPHLYNSAYQTSSFDSLGVGQWFNFNTAVETGMTSSEKLDFGESIAIKTPVNRWAKIYIKSINNVGDTGYFFVVFKYSYQPIANYRCF